jgi:hypothetical protein
VDDNGTGAVLGAVLVSLLVAPGVVRARKRTSVTSASPGRSRLEGGSAEPERDAWTLIAWLEGTAFYALAGAGTAAAPSLDVLREQLTRLLAGLGGGDQGCGDQAAATGRR